MDKQPFVYLPEANELINLTQVTRIAWTELGLAVKLTEGSTLISDDDDKEALVRALMGHTKGLTSKAHMDHFLGRKGN